MFDLGGGAILRLTTIADHTPGPHTVLGWKVADIDAAMLALGTRGVAFLVFPGFGQDAKGVWRSPDGRMRVAWFNDPEGNGLSLTQG